MKAYPNLQLTVSEMGQVRSINEVEDGMDLRDYFAAKAMQALVSLPDIDMSHEAIAELAYKIAGAMMKAREA